MSSILMKLQYLEFPECTKEALNYLVRNFSTESHRIPGISSNNENFASEVAQEYILDMSRRRGHNSRKLNACHELQLLEMVCSTLQEAPEHSCYGIFSAIFGGHVDPAKTNFMTKLVSMAISISCNAVLGCAALWMQEQGSQSQSVCDLAQRLVDDYCLLYPNVSVAFKKLPKVSSLFTCNFITALTTIYTFTDVKKSPPQVLLECIVDWISNDPCLCSDSVRLVRIHSNFTCPVSGLVRWCILGPIVTTESAENPSTSKSQPSMLLSSQNSTSSILSSSEHAQKNGAVNASFDVNKLTSLFSRLHLGVLLSLEAYRTMELKEQLFSYADMYIVSKTLAAQYRGGQCTEHVLQVINTSVDRLAQTIQVAMTTGCLPDKFDMRQVCEGLPANRLLQMIMMLRYGPQAQAMDLS